MLIAQGESVFRTCAGCHAVGSGARNKVGPQLNNLVGRTAGTAGDYRYSAAMTAAGGAGLVWTEKSLAAWLKGPRRYVNGTKMSFPGLRSDDDIAAVIAYLKSFDSDGLPPPDASSYEPR